MSNGYSRAQSALNSQMLLSVGIAAIIAGWSNNVYDLNTALLAIIILLLIYWGLTGFPIPASATRKLNKIAEEASATEETVSTDGGGVQTIEPKEPEEGDSDGPKTSGGGAAAGAIAGALAGASIGGPVGALVGGLIGGFAGDKAESEGRKHE